MGLGVILNQYTLAVGVAGLAFVALAAWLFFLDLSDRLNRALALFLFLRGIMNIAPAIYHTERPGLGNDLGAYASIPLVFAILHFLLQYRHRLRATPVPRYAPWSLLALGIAADLLYLLDHELSTGTDTVGPLFVLDVARIPMYAVVAWILARDAGNAPSSAQRASLGLVSLGFVLDALFLGVNNTGQIVAALGYYMAPARPWLALSSLVWPAAVACSLATLRSVARWTQPDQDRLRRRYLITAAFCGASAIVSVTLILVPSTSSVGFQLSFVADGIWTLALPALASFALLRHQLFGFDLKIKITIRRGTIAAVFLAVLFGAAEVAQNLFSDRFGLLYGGLAAAALLLALGPLQRAAERLASTALPDARPLEELDADARLRLYTEQVQVAWSDGAVSAKERRLLEITRQRLGVGAEDALRIEREALQVLTKG